jgi:hypothetical protein
MSRPLRIFLCCQQDVRPQPIPAYRFWADYFRSAFAEAGHTCLEAPGCDWAEGLVARPAGEQATWRERTWQRAVDWIRAEHARRPIDLFLSYLYPGQVDAGGLREVGDLGIPRANFFCDNVRIFRKAPPEFAAFDLHWVPEAGALELYRRARLPFLHAPMACWVAPQWRTVPAAESLPPTFVGTSDSQRRRLFAEAYRLGLEMDVRGPGWTGEEISWDATPPGRGFALVSNQWAFAAEHGLPALARKLAQRLFPPEAVDHDFTPTAGPACLGDDYWRVLRESRVCVGVNRFPSLRWPIDRPNCYSRLRDLEGPMAGAAYLTEFAPGLDGLYEIGREIEVYRDAPELVAKTVELSSDPARRRRMRELGQRRALGEHGIALTIAKIAQRLGIS